MLRDELQADLLGRGYSGMDDAAAAADLNTAYRSRNRTSLTASEVLQNLDLAEWDALQTVADGADAAADIAGHKVRNVGLVLSAAAGDGGVDPFGKAQDLIVGAFGGGSATVTALKAARVEAISRAEELRDSDPRFPVPVKVGHVDVARAA